MMLLKLRRDWYEEQGGKPSLRDFPRRAAVARVGAVLGAAPPDARHTTDWKT